jgi:tRNA(Arg) A34 adenosine deaminase TadA
MNDSDFMWAAIRAAQAGIAKGQSPFGAAVARGGELIVAAHNVVWLTTDPTAHAEVNAIRLAAGLLHSIDLSQCDIFATTEPCPMCLAAIHWAKFRRVVFGATIADAANAGFTELTIPAATMAVQGGSKLKVENGLLENECRDLFRQWRAAGGRPY